MTQNKQSQVNKTNTNGMKTIKNLRSSLVATAGERRKTARTHSRFTRWIAVLALLIAPLAAPVLAHATDTVRISGRFSMDYLVGELDLSYFDPDLLAVYYHGHEHTWTLTLHGTSPSHYSNGSYYGTEIHSTSFDLKFFGPDAATLNGVVSKHLAGKSINVYLQNSYYSYGGGFAIMHVGVGGGFTGQLYFYTGQDMGSVTLFPADADGYPVVTPEPFSIEPDITELSEFEMFSGTGFNMGSLAGPVTFELVSEPRLTITHSNNVVMVSWPSPSTGFSLQQNNQLNTTNWVTPAETVNDTGDIKFITVDPSGGSRFYRLFKPTQETGTVTVTGTFTSDSGEHSWSLTLYGTTHSHSQGWSNLWYGYFTEVQATSFDLRFTGPDADDLNRVASEQFPGGKAGLQLRNVYDSGYNLSTMALWVSSPDESATFRAGNDGLFTPGVFPSDAYGYPIVTSEPFIFWNQRTSISWYGDFYDDYAEGGPFPNAEISGSLGPDDPPPPPTLGIEDTSVVEGDRGSTMMRFTVTLSGGTGPSTIRVSYRTVDGTASAASDYSAASGTLAFPPGVLSQTIMIAVAGDHKREPDETLTVELFNAVGASVVDAVARGTLLNDD
ncbi:MAG TPA: Calx-beta domain-containing protein [Verrucomicrobiae bacterium]|nr:Calx-beta domain-containing protein [Verrucomicrobiae bacterium]